MIKSSIKFTAFMAVIVLLLTGCHKDLDRFPPNDVTANSLYTSAAGYKQVLAKVYGGMALTGNTGPVGSGDIAGIDEGFSDFLRQFWSAQELSTDEAVIAWNDAGLHDFHYMNWSSSNQFVNCIYNRSLYVVTLTNEFIRESADEKLASRGIAGADADAVKAMRAEARFIRAFQYWVLMDLFGNPAFVTEATPIGSGIQPEQIQRAALFAYVEKELKELETLLPAAKGNEYGRADRAAVWSLLARLYLNANVYTGTPKWTEAAANAKKVIDAGYSLMPNYMHLFMADNSVSNTEAIWTLNYDGLKTQNYGGTTFLVNASVGGTMDATVSGLQAWGGTRTTKNLPNLFPDFNGTADKRAMFYTQQNIEINNVGTFTDGFPVSKFRNRKRDGSFGTDPSRTFSDIDFPVFRLAEMYLIYMEAAVRTGTDIPTALNYANLLRQRAYGSNAGNIATVNLNLDYIIDERGRELYWEGFRRTDLIRFNRFTEGTYLWPWKGGVKNGTGVDAYRKLYPIPSTEVSSNPNIKQNPNY